PPGVVPPDLLGHAAEELKRRDHAFEDRLRALEGERQHKRGIRVGPGRNQEGDQASTVGKVDVDMAEISFEPPSRKMPQGNERFLVLASMLEDIALHLRVTTAVTVLVAEATEHLRRSV